MAWSQTTKGEWKREGEGEGKGEREGKGEGEGEGEREGNREGKGESERRQVYIILYDDFKGITSSV